MKREIIERRQREFKDRLECFIKENGRRPRENELRGYSYMYKLAKIPGKIIVDDLYEFLTTHEYSYKKNWSKNRIEEGTERVLNFIKLHDRLPDINKDDPYETYLRDEDLSHIEIRDHPVIKAIIKRDFVSRLLTDQEASEVVINWIKTNLIWPRQGSSNKTEKRIYHFLKKKETRAKVLEYYPELIRYEEQLKPKRKRTKYTSKEEIINFYESWCETYNSWPKWELHDKPDWGKAVSIHVDSVKPHSERGFTPEDCDRIKMISIRYGYKKPKRNNNEISEDKKYKKIYLEFSRLYKGSKTKIEVYKILAEKFDLNVETIKGAVEKGSKDDMTYNTEHYFAKDRFTSEIIRKYSNSVKSVLDVFSGENSVYLDHSRTGNFCFDNKKVNIVTNDLNFPGHTYQKDARELLDFLVKTKQTFDLVDLDPFDQPLYYISMINLIRMTNKCLIITIGCMDRVKTQKSIKALWDISFECGTPIEGLIEEKFREYGSLLGKRIKLIKMHHYPGGTYRMAFSIEKLEG